MNEFIDVAVEPGLRFLAEWSIRWAVLLLPVMLILCLPWSRRLPAAARHGICLAGLIAGLCLPLLPRWGNGLWADRPVALLAHFDGTYVADGIDGTNVFIPKNN